MGYMSLCQINKSEVDYYKVRVTVSVKVEVTVRVLVRMRVSCGRG